MSELRAGLCYGNDSPGVMSPTPKPFEAVYPPTDLSEVVASLRRELSSMDKVVEKLAAELAALQEAVRWYHGYEVKGWPEFPPSRPGRRYGFRSAARTMPVVVRALEEER